MLAMNGWERERFFRHRANFGKKNGALYSMFRFAVETQCKNVESVKHTRKMHLIASQFTIE